MPIEGFPGPDGSEKKWDADVRLVSIREASFHLPITAETEDAEPPERDEPRTPIGLDLVPELRKLGKRQMWLFYGLLALAAAIFFRK